MRPRQPGAFARPYNTGLKVGADWPGRAGLGETRFAETARGVVFAHSLTDPLPEKRLQLVAGRAECLYSEIPWLAGSTAFYDRAGLAPRPHAEYVAGAAALIDSLRKPTFLVGSKHDLGVIAGRAPERRIRLNGAKVWLAILHTDASDVPEVGVTSDLLAWLAARFSGAYDFSCGYGNALSYFAYCIGSDIDLKCLSYVHKEILGG